MLVALRGTSKELCQVICGTILANKLVDNDSQYQFDFDNDSHFHYHFLFENDSQYHFEKPNGVRERTLSPTISDCVWDRERFESWR